MKSIQEEHLRRLSNCKLAEFPSFMIPRTLSYLFPERPKGQGSLFPERPKGQGSLLVTSRVNTLWGSGGFSFSDHKGEHPLGVWGLSTGSVKGLGFRVAHGVTPNF